MARRSLSLVAVAAISLAAVACSSSDGRTLPPPDPHRTTTSVSTPVVAQPSDGGDGGIVEVFSLYSAAFVEGTPIPARYTCEGDNISPPLDWIATPAAAELALVVRDRDAGGFVHWVVSGIDPLIQGLGEGGVPEGAVEAANDGGTIGWFGPCPPSGAHAYVFTLHALPEPLALTPGLPAGEAARLVEGASSGQASLTGTYATAG
ncbi:MAG: YbhB/YbcL family Raf kinase inhibitor-like protein [Acidimicrobiales bacterium]